MIKKEDSLGIPNYGIHYFKMPQDKNSIEDALNEFIEIHSFINQVVSSNTVPEFQGKQKRLQFINYGSTQLVYVLTVDEKRQYTFLVNQPSTPFGVGKREFENLKMLSRVNKDNVIIPLYYFKGKNNDYERELYVTPYYYQSRCIGVEDKEWGIWIPEPKYFFHNFEEQDRRVINASMIALLIKLYDDKGKKGLSDIRLDGGDFMLEKGFENYDINFENILKKMKLIAARNLVQMELHEYTDRLKTELSGNVRDDEELKILGKKLKAPLKPDEIESGIKLGYHLREEQKEKEMLI